MEYPSIEPELVTGSIGLLACLSLQVGDGKSLNWCKFGSWTLWNHQQPLSTEAWESSYALTWLEVDPPATDSWKLWIHSPGGDVMQAWHWHCCWFCLQGWVCPVRAPWGWLSLIQDHPGMSRAAEQQCSLFPCGHGAGKHPLGSQVRLGPASACPVSCSRWWAQSCQSRWDSTRGAKAKGFEREIAVLVKSEGVCRNTSLSGFCFPSIKERDTAFKKQHPV